MSEPHTTMTLPNGDIYEAFPDGGCRVRSAAQVNEAGEVLVAESAMTNPQPTVRLSAQGLPVLVLPGVGEVTLPRSAADTFKRTMNTGREQPIEVRWEATRA